MSSRADPRRAALAVAALLEALAWFAPAAAFLWIYTSRLGGTAAAVLPHLGVVAALAAAALMIRWLLVSVWGDRASAVGGALVTTTVLLSLWLYYVAAVVGFSSWGYLVSWGLISTYIRQIAYMPEVFGRIVYVAAGLLLLAFMALAGGIYAFYRGNDWLPRATRCAPRTMDAAGLTALLVLAVFCWRYTDAPPTSQGEPVALSFWPDPANRKFQHNNRPQGAQLLRDELAARATYANVKPRPGSNVILIVSDALRSRNMAVYGYGRPTTPFLSEMLATGRAVRMRRVQSVCAESACGLMGIASSRYVHQFVDKPLTLAEVLRLHGYEAHLALSGDHTNFYGLRAMYGAVDSYFDGSMARWAYANDDRNVLNALSQLKTRSTQSNFIQIHLMSSHVLGRRSVRQTFGRAENYFPPPAGIASEEQRQRFANYYDDGVLGADETIREVLAELRKKGLMDDAIVIVTADHGEYIGERGLYAHAKGVYSEVIDIPLVLMTAGNAARLRIDDRQLASQVDIAPTVLSHLGLPIPATWSGIPLQAPAPAAARQVHFQQSAEFGVVERARDGRIWKYWVDASSGHDFAFDLDRDPLESNNLAEAIAPADRKRWRRALMPLEINAREFESSR